MPFVPDDIFWFTTGFNRWHTPVGVKMSTVTLARLEKALTSMGLIANKGDPHEAETCIYGIRIIIGNTLKPDQYEYVYAR